MLVINSETQLNKLLATKYTFFYGQFRNLALEALLSTFKNHIDHMQ